MISNLKFTLASADERARGLLGWLSLTTGIWRLDGLTLRRTRRGRLAVSFPVRVDGMGRQHPIVQPLDDRARRKVEAEIIAQLGLMEASRR